jgi:hypothetical protein
LTHKKSNHVNFEYWSLTHNLCNRDKNRGDLNYEPKIKKGLH